MFSTFQATPPYEKMRETIVLYPSPLRGHIVAMFELGRLILNHHPRFSVVIILSSASTAAPVADYPSVTVIHLPSAAAPAAERDQTPFDLARCDAPNLRLALAGIASAADLRALIIDGFSDAAFPVAAALGIPTYYFSTSGAVALALFLHFPTLHGRTTKSFKDLGDKTVVIPGLPPIKALDMPSGMLDRSWAIYGYFLDACRNMISSSGIIVNTCESLETRIISSIKEGFQGRFSAVQLKEMASEGEQGVSRGEAALALPLSMSDEDRFVSADELAKRVTELMMGSGEGKVVREQVLTARDGVLEALSDGGSSQVSLAAVAALWKRS
ncbi:hypothetical protein NL676_031222 [Syzygium grande]|nr:hypothetical protein NL676_031222 [Syzygium grande]